MLIRDDDSQPQITTQPTETFAVLGKPATLSVTATNTLSYQWFFDGVLIPGATAASYPIATVAAPNEGTYTVRLTNGYGTISSAPADLIIIPDPTAIVPGFSVPTLLTGSVFALAPAPDGGVYVGGSFLNVNGEANRDYLVKINANGSLDTAFNPPLINNIVRDIVVQPDGKIIAVGQFTSVAGSTLQRIVRLDPNGTLDPTFATNAGTGANGDIYAVALDADGSIFLGGNFSSWKNVDLGNGDDLIRLNANGTLAAQVYFDFNLQILDLLLLPGGDILASYNTTSSSVSKVRRFNADLTLDSSLTYASGRTKVERMALTTSGNFLFAGPNGLYEVDSTGAILTTFPNTGYLALDRQVNGKVLAGGSSSSRLFRYLPDGSVDPTFSLGTIPNSTVQALAIRNNGSFWVGGSFTAINGITVNYLALLNGDPIPLAITAQPAALTIVDPGEDVTLSVAATGTTALSYQWFRGNDPLSDQPGISGSQTTTLTLTAVDDTDAGNYTVIVTNEAGTRTSNAAQLIVLGAPEILSLSGDVSLLEGSPLTLTVEASGASTLEYQWFKGTTPLPLQTSATLSIPSASTSDAGTYSVVVTNDIDSTPSGPIVVTVRPNSAIVAPGFTPPTVIGSPVNQVLPLPGGRVLVGGNFTSISDGTTTSGARLAVVDESGAVIPIAGLSADGVVESLRLQSDGKILIAGSFNNIGTTACNKLARLNENLTLDPGFNPTGINSFQSAFDLAQEAGGTLIAVGSFTDVGGVATADYAIRLNDNGTYNDTFTSGANSFVYRVFPQPDGDLIFTGWFTWSAGTEQYVVRTNSAGTVDSTTDYNVGFFNVTDSFQLANGDLLASNAFGNGVLRLAPTGGNISPFPVGGGITGSVRAFAESPTGDLLLGGAITAAAGQTAGRIILLNADNTRDPDFNAGTGFDLNVNDIAVTSAGRIWVGGEFTTYNGIPANKLILLKGEAAAPADPYATFVATLPVGERGETSDPDFDGVPNLIEFVFGSAPGNFSPAPAMTESSATGAALSPSLDPAKLYRTLEIETPKDTQGVDLTLAASADLTFADAATATEFGTRTDNGTTEIRRYFLTPALDDTSTLFWRLQAIR